MVAKVRERLAVSKQATHKFHLERFKLKKLNNVEVLSSMELVTQIKMQERHDCNLFFQEMK
jgi:hypothetical protein